MLELLAPSVLGAMLGVRHAFEPDHFAAVATLVDHDKTSARAVLLGMYWGLGHTLAIVAACAAVALLQAEMPPTLLRSVNMVVCAMLVLLGTRAMLRAGRSVSGHTHRFRRQTRVLRPGTRAAARGGRFANAVRPLLVGIIHGLAGSGALTALVLTTLPSASSRIVYLVLFGVGSTLSMAAMSGVVAWPLTRLGGDHAAARTLTFCVGLGSAMLGLLWTSTVIRTH